MRRYYNSTILSNGVKTTRWSQAILLCLTLVISSQASARGFEKEIPYGKAYSSPDGTLIVRLIDSQDPIPLGLYTKFLVNVLSIKNAKTGQTSAVEVDGPPLYLGWTKDSKTIVTVEHAAQGNTLNVYNYDGTSWKPAEVGPPTKQITYSDVSALKTGLHSITASFLVEYEHADNQRMADLDKYTIVVDGRTGVTKRVISHWRR